MRIEKPSPIRSRRRELPRAWMRGLWLLYVLFVFMQPLMTGGPARQWALAAGSVAVFLPLYMWYWSALDDEGRHAIVPVAAIALLGLVMMPTLSSANVYVVYSAALVPFALPPSRAVGYIAALAAVALAVALLQPVPARYWLAIPTTILVAVIGGANVLFAEHVRRNAQLWRAQEDVEEMAAVAERERISRDLHDLLGHTLSVIAVKSELASRLADVDPPRAAAEIRAVERVSREALTEVRAAVEGYRGHGFAGELRKAAAILESAGVRLDVRLAPTAMSARHESVMALALHEAITDVVRHARASSCHISLVEHRGHLLLTVRDDGVGKVMREGHGLAGMRERVTALGGAVDIDGTDGTVLTVRIPVVGADEGGAA